MKKIFIILAFALVSCGTGPWITYKENFDVYKKSIFENPKVSIKTNGIFVEQGELNNNSDYRAFMIFYRNGYCLLGKVDNAEWKISLSKFIQKLKLQSDQEFNLYRVANDSLFIDRFGSNKNLYYRWVKNYECKVLSDSEIEVIKSTTTFDNYPVQDLSIVYKFYPSTEIPDYKPTSWFIDKKWYNKNLHESRK